MNASLCFPARRAVVDVGTNSVKLLVGDLEAGQITPVIEESRQTRLGEGFYAEHRLQAEPIARTAETVRAFAEKARSLGAGQVRIVATSAAREAVNAEVLRAAILQAAGSPLEIISGEQEAELGYQGVSTHPDWREARLLLVDLGGGSLQFTLGEAGRARLAQSFPLGCVRLLEKFRPGPRPEPGLLQKVRAEIGLFVETRVIPVLRPALDTPPGHPALLIGTGGTATILARMERQMSGFDRAAIEETRLSTGAVRQWTDRLWGLPIEERRLIAGLPANRADVVLFGAAIYGVIMEAFGFNELRFSTRGLRFGALLTMAPPVC